jgi:hypothetical protein
MNTFSRYKRLGRIVQNPLPRETVADETLAFRTGAASAQTTLWEVITRKLAFLLRGSFNLEGNQTDEVESLCTPDTVSQLSSQVRGVMDCDHNGSGPSPPRGRMNMRRIGFVPSPYCRPCARNVISRDRTFYGRVDSSESSDPAKNSVVAPASSAYRQN